MVQEQPVGVDQLRMLAAELVGGETPKALNASRL